MIKLFTNYYLLNRSGLYLIIGLIISFYNLSNSYAANVPCNSANSQAVFVPSGCTLCTITNPSNAVDNSTSTFSTLHVNPAVANSFVEEFLYFPNSGNGGDSVFVVLSFPPQMFRESSFSNVSVASYNGRHFNDDRLPLTSTSVNVKHLRSIPGLPFLNQLVIISFAPQVAFNRIELRIATPDVANNPTDVNIYYAYREIPAPVVQDASVCTGGTINLKATGPAGAIIKWYSQSSGGASLHTGSTYTVSNVTTNKTYYVESSKNGCANPRRSKLNLSILLPPATPVINDVTVCRGFSATLVATGTTGSIFSWFTQPVGGIMVHQGNSFTTPAIFSNVTYYVQASNGCVNSTRGVAKAIVQVGKGMAKAWDKVLGGSSNDVLYDGVATSDGGYLLSGWTGSNNGDISEASNTGGSWLLKTDANGNKLWDKILELNGGTLVRIISIPDGFLIGQAGGDFILYKIDNTGNIIWKKTYGGSQGDGIATIVPTSDGGYVLGGNTSSHSNDGDVTTGTHGFSDYWIIKIDSAGNKVWDKTFGGSLQDVLGEIVPTFDGGYLLAGVTNSNNGDVLGYHGLQDFWLIKVDGGGNKIWAKTFGGSGGEFIDFKLGLIQTTDGNYLLAGGSQSTDGDITQNVFGVGNFEGWMLKIDGAGNKIWDKNHAVGGDGMFNSVVKTSDGYVCGGYVQEDEPDYWIVRTDAAGNELSSKLYGGKQDDELITVIPSNDGGFLAIGFASSEDGDVHPSPAQLPVQDWSIYNGWIIKFNTLNCPGIPIGSLGKTSSTDNNGAHATEQNLVFPNPFTDHINLRFDESTNEPSTIEIYNSSGIKIYSNFNEVVMANQNEVIISTAVFEPGIYICKVSIAGKVYSQKIIKY